MSSEPAVPAWPPENTSISDEHGPGAARGITRRQLAIVALAAVACVAAAIVLLGGGGKGTKPDSGVPAGDTTTTVARRTLTESSTVDGTLGYGTSLELYDRLAGTFTWLPPVGATVTRGGTLFRLNDLPVVLMYGSVPAYRTLKQGISEGPDVAQLNRNLIDLGFDPYGAISESSRFSEATTAAVRRWQKAEGLPETGEVELGRVVFAPSARRVTAVHVVLGQDPPGKPKTAKRKHKRKPGKANEPRGQAAPASSPAKETGKDSPTKEGGNEPKSEGAAGAGTAVLTTTPTQQLVQLKLKAEQQQLAHLGEQAPVTLPGGKVVQGTIVEVGTVASEAKSGEDEKGADGGGSSESGEAATIPVTLTLSHPARHLDQAPVSVELVKDVRENVLAVPATALLATGGGGYAIEVLEDSRHTELAVTPGMFADGYVQVEGTGLREGQTVIESE